ncbi:ArsR family transcriptional regulator [Deltaproteobacteria bacterium Smac51]|nr:ArsR family transcriptional regulator [Deltaproteobacteria bacterium Smac51]
MRKSIPKDVAGEWEKVARVLDALGSDMRQSIFMLFEPGEWISVKQLSVRFNMARTAILYHINALQEAGVVKSRKRGKDVILSVDFEVVDRVADKVLAYIKKYGGSGK